ncbi:MAG: nucleoside hydrolase [Oscillatoria sp. SIO1A7]|nr:nucleoside hydrolase [Oscillatoria sp. SIO1A7]
MNQRKIIIDTDPGGDDCFALLWLMSLAKQGWAKAIAVTTAAGNVGARCTFTNASKILALGGFDPVEIGRASKQISDIAGDESARNAALDDTQDESARDITRDIAQDVAKDAAHIHGVDGIGNLAETLPEVPRPFDAARYSDDIIIEKLDAAPGEITLVAIAPLTNLAAAEAKSPGILRKAKELVILAGAFQCRGNIATHAEFNIFSDPEAAEKVLNSRDDIVILPLDITHQLVFTPEMAESIFQTNPDSDIAKLIVSLCQFMTATNLRYRDTDGKNGFLVHDAATLAYLFYPETLLLRRARVVVETQGRYSRGQTLFDDRHLPKTTPNAWVALKVDADNLLAILVEDLKLLIE